MAEICCGVASESKKSAPCERSSRVTRRKSLEVREFKFITDPICCGVASESKKSAPCERSSRVTRRKSLDVREFKFITDPDVQLEEGKRQKLEIANCSIDVLQNSVEGRDEGSEISENSNSNSNSSTNSSSLEVVSDLSNPPSPLLEDQFDIDRCPKFGLVSVRGRRREMEDAVAIHPSFFRQDSQIPLRLHFFGVYDGHGCSHVAKNCRDRLHQLVKEELENQVASSDWKDAMERSFSRMDEEVQIVPNTNCRCELQTTQCDAVGSTAVVAIVSQNKIVVANCGDSRAVLCRGGKAVPLSIDHKPDRPDELLRIEASGGRVIYWDGPRVLGVLAMSRAIGDDYLKPYVSSEPEITITDRTGEDECLILASDGLWDVVSNDTACSIVRMCLTSQRPILHVSTIENRERNSDKACSDAALLLTKLAMARNSTDNISVVVVDLRRKDI